MRVLIAITTSLSGRWTDRPSGCPWLDGACWIVVCSLVTCRPSQNAWLMRSRKKQLWYKRRLSLWRPCGKNSNRLYAHGHWLVLGSWWNSLMWTANRQLVEGDVSW